MDRTVESRNKALVLQAFDTLFTKRDYAAAEKFWSPRYIQHSAHIAPCSAPLKLWTGGLVSWMQETH